MIDKKHNKWLILGGIFIPLLLLPLFSQLAESLNNSILFVIWFVFCLLGLFSIIFGIINYSNWSNKAKIWTSILIEIILIIIGVAIMIYLLSTTPLYGWGM